MLAFLVLALVADIPLSYSSNPHECLGEDSVSLLQSGAELSLVSNVLQSETVVAETEDLSMSHLHIGPPTTIQDVAFLLKTAQHFKRLAEKGRQDVEERHVRSETVLKNLTEQTQDADVSSALQQSITGSMLSLRESTKVYDSIASFAESMEGLLQAASSKGEACHSTTCGEHSSCSITTNGAECICHEGYLGTGSNCYAPPGFRPYRLFQDEETNHLTQAAEMHVCMLGKDRVAIVFRDTSREDTGRVVIGRALAEGNLELSPAEQFTEGMGKAFDPRVTAAGESRFVVAWRDQDRSGSGWIRGATTGDSTLSLAWGSMASVEGRHSHRMALVSLPSSRVAVLASIKVPGTQHTPAESFGNSMLVQVGELGSLKLMGSFQFADTPVARLEVTRVSAKGFVVATRGSPLRDEIDVSSVVRQEATAFYGEMLDDMLEFGTQLNLEPSADNIWARGVSLIAPNTFAYAYQDGTQRKVKMAVVEVDPASKSMKVVSAPTVMHEGVSPYVSMLSVPYSAADPYSLTYYESEGQSRVKTCRWLPADKQLERCGEFTWLTEGLTSVSGAQLGAGRALMVFTPRSGIPHYAAFGLSKA